MRLIASLALAALLAGCGADGEPERPQFSGSIGLGIGSGGVTPSASVALTRGPVTLGIGV